MQTLSRSIALIVAAGSGTRLGGVPKQFQKLGNKAVLRHSIDTFLRHPDITQVYVVIGAGQESLYADAITDLNLPSPIIGGSTRQQSVRAGLEQIACDGGCNDVLIHDAARPFVSVEIIREALTALKSFDGAAPALTVTDSLRSASETKIVLSDVDRENVYRVQTPQCFQFAKILQAHQIAQIDATDDISIARAAGLNVVLTLGDEANFKITHADDLVRAENIVSQSKITRTASGYDVHRFGPGDHLWLCGLKIAHTQGIIAHSDGDVALHALTDALLGTISAGDIGSHFPPSDAKWKNVASDQFVAHAAALIRARGGIIDHVDITVICERPKIGPHRDAMQIRVAEILTIARENVSIKATTTEGLGFTGRNEGIAAQACASVRM
jgi:2-C-methyl-D-erythritol 4-phosphate cytidylyltransferase / 2-C-methyl-D-erythritol 2,4-cyclodiphosphate synthase